jgi:hypothetical protein
LRLTFRKKPKNASKNLVDVRREAGLRVRRNQMLAARDSGVLVAERSIRDARMSRPASRLEPRHSHCSRTDRYECEANHAVFRTKLSDSSTVFNAGRYLDTVQKTHRRECSANETELDGAEITQAVEARVWGSKA